jgi:hypothetical protein
MLVTAAADGNPMVWRVATGEMPFVEQQLKEKFGEGDFPFAIAPPANPVEMFAIGSADRVVRVFGPK